MPIRRVLGCAAVAGIVLLSVGCAQQLAVRASERACQQYGVTAIAAHVTVTSVPAACRGLSHAQVNSAVAGAVRTVAARTARGKTAERTRAASLIPYLADLVAQPLAATAAPAAPAAAAAGPAPSGPGSFGIAALLTWLVTAGFGIRMLTGWLRHGGPRRARAAGGLPPSAVFTHAGLAVTGLLVWIAYLVSGVAGVGWAGVSVLLVVTAFGVALISLWLPDGPAAARHPPASVVAAHGLFAVTAIVLVLAAVVHG